MLEREIEEYCKISHMFQSKVWTIAELFYSPWQHLKHLLHHKYILKYPSIWNHYWLLFDWHVQNNEMTDVQYVAFNCTQQDMALDN